MVIVHVVAPAEFGGLERVVQMLGGGLRGLGHEVHVAAVLPAAATGDPFLAPLSGAGVYTHRIVVPARAYRRERAAIAALCRAVRPDAVHTHGYRPDVVDAGVARHLRIPVVTTAHGFTGGPLRNRVYEYLQRRAFRRFDAVVAVSRVLAADLTRARVPQSRIHTVPNAWRRRAGLADSAARRDRTFCSMPCRISTTCHCWCRSWEPGYSSSYCSGAPASWELPTACAGTASCRMRIECSQHSMCVC